MTKNSNYDDYIEGKGFKIFRKGRHIIIDTHRSAEEYEELTRCLAAYHEELPKKIQEKSQELEKEISKFNPFDIISNIALINLWTNPETYKEHEQEGGSAFVEYLSLLLLKRPFSQGIKCQISGKDIEDMQKQLRDIFNDTIWYYITEHPSKKSTQTPDVFDELRIKTILNELFVRSPGYVHHLEEVLRNIFSPFEKWMEENLGFTIDDAIAFDRLISGMITDRLYKRVEKAKEFEKEFIDEVDAYRNGQSREFHLDGNMLKELTKLPQEEMTKKVRNICTAWTFFGFGDTCSFTPEELASIAKKDAKRAKAFLETFSLKFGSIPSNFYMPAMTHELKKRPFLHHMGKYLCPSPLLVLWSIRPLLESTLNPDSVDARKTSKELWEKYQNVRADYLETKTMELLQKALKHGQFYGKLEYEIEGNGKKPELDGLIIFDTALFFVECKAGTMTDPARRGAPLRMESDIKSLVADAHNQALRARNYYSSNESPEFKTADGQLLKIDKKNIKYILMMTVSLEPLGMFITDLCKTAELGIFHEGDLPWSVSLLDLWIMCELIDIPCQFIHYLQRRLRLNELKMITAHDEIDWFGHYLHEGLYFEEVPSSGLDRMTLGTFTTEINDYYSFITGQRKTPANKPCQPMPDLFRTILEELENKHLTGYLDVVCVLLDMGWKDREDFSKFFAQLREKSSIDGKLHDFTLLYSKQRTGLMTVGLTTIAGKNIPLKELFQKALSYSEKKKHEQKVDKWICLISHLRLPDLVHGWIILDNS